MIPNYEKLQLLSDQELIEMYNQRATNTSAGTGFYIEELSRRKADRQNQKMLEMTKNINRMTLVITMLTIVNVFLVGYTILS